MDKVNSYINKLITDNGLHFLLYDNDSYVVCNDKRYDMPNMAQDLGQKLNDSALLCSFKSHEQGRRALSTIMSNDTFVLGKVSGVRLVSKSPINHIPFAGGSFSATFAQYDENRWKVIKSCRRYNHPDKDLRLIAEIESIKSLPSKAQKLFPVVLGNHVSQEEVRYELEYVPYHTFAELIKSGQLEKRQLSDLLETIYDSLFDILYLPTDPNKHLVPVARYDEIISRRFHDIRQNLASDHYIHTLISAGQVEINGAVYPGLEQTIQRAKDFIGDKHIPYTYNHGDLIFQDILIDPNTKDFRLIDANGHSSSYMYDITKTLLCLETNYDLFYDGEFSFTTELGETPRANITFQNKEHLASLKAMRTSFWRYLEKNESIYFADIPDWRKVLLTLCGLQNIAIVMFHTLHHHKHERASAFLLSGIRLINDSLSPSV